MSEPGIGGDGSTALSCHAIESLICEIWSEFFACAVHPDDDFYELGGDSVAIIETVHTARQQGLPLRSSEALRNPTPARLAEYLTIGGGPVATALPAAFTGIRAHGTPPVQSVSETILEQGDGAPLYLVHSDSHRRLEREAALRWESPGPVRAFRLPAASPDPVTVAQLAAALVRALRAQQPTGPYRLAGFGAGAAIAFEMGRRLHDDGEPVDFVALIGPPAPDPASAMPKTVEELLAERVAMLARRFALTGADSAADVLAAMQEAGWYEDAVTADELADAQLSWARLASAIEAYRPSPADFPTVLIQDVMYADAMERGWNPALGDAKALWLDHGTLSPRAVIEDPRSSAFLREVLAA